MAIEDSPINRYPAGLLGLTDIKAMGKVPARFAQNVQGILNLDPFYRAETRKVVTTNDTINGIGLWGLLPKTPSANKLWLVESVHLVTLFNTPAGGSIRCAPCIIRYPGISDEIVWAGNPSPMFSATATMAQRGIMMGHTFAVPFVMLPGMYLKIDCSAAETLGAGISVDAQAVVTEVDF